VLTCLILLAFCLVTPCLNAAEPAIERRADGVVLPVGDGQLLLQVRADNIVRVAFAKDRRFFARDSLVLTPRSSPATPAGGWTLQSTAREAILATPELRVRVDRQSGAVTFLDPSGAPILAERAGGRAIEPAVVQDEKTFHVQQQWEANADESLHGLGQQQLGLGDLKGYDLDLWQRNTVVVVPFLVSSRGYGILWDNTSFTRFGDLRPFVAIPADCLRDAGGQPGGLTRSTFTASQPDSAQETTTTADLTVAPATRRGNRVPTSTRFAGTLVPPTSGDYQLQTYSNGRIKVWLDDQLVIDHWRQAWLTEYDQVKTRLEAGRHYAIRVEAGGEQMTTMQLRWKIPPAADAPAATSLWSEVGDGVDYYFIYGGKSAAGSLDRVVGGYRQLTGRASLMPRWAFGLWQSRQRYETAQQSLEVVDEFRRRGIPFDNIVQDWQYWPRDQWGSHAFDAQRFPDPDRWLAALHERHARVMISVWGKFYPGTANFDAMQAGGFLYQPTLRAGTHDWLNFNYTFYDAFNPAARRLFWSQLEPALFRRGVDAWWMDATEPDVTQPSPATLETQRANIGRTALGTASRVLNAYPLVNSQAVYEGQRGAAPDQRVFILTRSGFAGIQRYATATWSGDVTSTWTAFAKQIPAGLGFSISGVPYWTSDIGGYTMERKFAARNPTPEALDEWRELNVRWFEFGTFCPLLRVHGELQPREMWTLGGDSDPAYQAELKFDRLRYRLLPYVYSVAGAVTQRDGTMMRPLVMDFPRDAVARAKTDELMFGPALLVAPVTSYRARSRTVYLPEAAGGWFDFWSGSVTAGAKSLEAAAPLDAPPLFVRAGAILPFGPELHYTDEKPADPITLVVYPGADGAFTLYEDDGLTYGYERGEFSEIPLRWTDATKTLSIDARRGKFPGMLAERTFQVVLVSREKPIPFSFTPAPVRVIRYTGGALSEKFE
jgi:alpha-D-xyloside xylohydrolase